MSAKIPFPPDDDSTTLDPGQTPGVAEPSVEAEEASAALASAEQAAPPDPPKPLEPAKKKGAGCFSPINVLVLLAVTLVLGSLLVPNWFRSQGAGGQLTACKSNLKNIGTALEMYSTDWSGKYPTSTTVLTPNYLISIPECPAAVENSYRVSFGPNAPMNEATRYEDYYYVECTGKNHVAVSISGNYPAYNGVHGLVERDPKGAD